MPAATARRATAQRPLQPRSPRRLAATASEQSWSSVAHVPISRSLTFYLPVPGLLFVKTHGPHDAFAFVHVNELIGLHVLPRIDLPAGPANLQRLDLIRFPQAEVNAQVVLRDIAAAATDFIDLLVGLWLIGRMRNAAQARADAAAIGFRADRAHLDPVEPMRGIAAQQLRIIVHRVHHHIDVAVIVEITEGAPA